MYRVPAKHKRHIVENLKNFIPLVSSLVLKNKSANEEDARVLITDILHFVLGYNKFDELKNELKSKNSRFDYAVKLTEGPNKSKVGKYDFIIEAKASYVELNDSVVEQTLQYCNQTGVDFFVLTNGLKWQLYKTARQGKVSKGVLLKEITLGSTNDFETLSEEFYLFSRWSYLNADWKDVATITNATKVEDVVAVLLSEKIIRTIARELSNEHDVKVDEDIIREIVEKNILKSWNGEVNKKLLKKLNEKPVKKLEDVKALPEAIQTSAPDMENVPCEKDPSEAA